MKQCFLYRCATAKALSPVLLPGPPWTRTTTVPPSLTVKTSFSYATVRFAGLYEMQSSGVGHDGVEGVLVDVPAGFGCGGGGADPPPSSGSADGVGSAVTTGGGGGAAAAPDGALQPALVASVSAAPAANNRTLGLNRFDIGSPWS